MFFRQILTLFQDISLAFSSFMFALNLFPKLSAAVQAANRHCVFYYMAIVGARSSRQTLHLRDSSARLPSWLDLDQQNGINTQDLRKYGSKLSLSSIRFILRNNALCWRERSFSVARRQAEPSRPPPIVRSLKSNFFIFTT